MKAPRSVDWVFMVLSTALGAGLAVTGDKLTDWIVSASMFCIAGVSVLRLIEDSEEKIEGDSHE